MRRRVAGVERRAGLSSDRVDSRLEFEDLVTDDVLATQLMIIRSPLIVKQAVEKRGLKKLSMFAEVGDPTLLIVQGLDVSKGTKSAREANVLTVKFRAGNSHDCAVVWLALIESYREFLADTYQNVSNETIGLITQAKDDIAKQLSAKESEYLEFRRKAPLHWTGGQADALNVHERRLWNIELTRQSLSVRKKQVESHVKSLKDAIQRGSDRESLVLMIERMDDMATDRREDTVLQIESERVELQAQEKVFLKDYGSDHYLIQEVREQIAT